MDTSEILKMRLFNHQLSTTTCKNPQEIVSWMGAVQAQDYNMAKWAVGVRLQNKDCSDAQVEEALNSHKIIRTHILRPTWHLVSIEDIYWMLQLTAPRIKNLLKSADGKRGVSSAILARTNTAIEDILSKTPNLTREELSLRVIEAGIPIDKSGISHIMMHAELDGIICNGVVRGKKQTYSLLEEKMPRPALLDKDEALGKLATKYFRSHGPATLQDFVWWSGLLVNEAKRAIEIITPDFIIKKQGSQTYILPDLPSNYATNADLVHLLPAFDEFLVSYRDRKEVLCDEHYQKVISTANGLFKPFIEKNGNAIGNWKRVATKNKVEAELSCFETLDQASQKLIQDAASAFNTFNQS